ncbi:MAG TPA: TonB family protein [Chitinophagaceae bacterium]|nr:TonB family protein [Chitinophagaceae bacterium]
MKPEMILQADVLDIVFENRNKEYGAYVLRKEYGQRLWRSLGGVLLLLLIAFASMFFKSNDHGRNQGPLQPQQNDTLKLVELPKPPPPKAEVPPPPVPPVRTIADPPPIIVPGVQVTDTIPTIDDRAKALVSDRTTDGPLRDTQTIAPPPQRHTGTGEPKVEQPVVVEPSVLREAEVMPEFPGGLSAWQRFLQKNLRFPDQDADGEEGRKIVVTVRFIVNEDGSLSGLEILESGGTEFDKEVLRVLNKSPKWVAGSNKGKKVKVYHKQPVIFKYEVDE